MSREDWRKWAKILREEREAPFVHLGTVDNIFHRMADLLHENNSKFNYNEFFKAVWIDKG